jgi:hypothetical protein
VLLRKRPCQVVIANNLCLLGVEDEVDHEELCLLLFRQPPRLSWVIERDEECGRQVLERQ